MIILRIITVILAGILCFIQSSDAHLYYRSNDKKMFISKLISAILWAIVSILNIIIIFLPA